MIRQNAVIVFTRTPQINRANPDEPYAALPWEDLDALFTAILGDLIEHACQTEDVDVLLYRNPAEFSDDFLHPYRDRVRCFDMHTGSIANHLPGAIEHALTSHYNRVIALFENQPLIGPTLFKKIFSQLGCEDDCIVVGPTPNEGAYLLGVKSNHSALFGSDEINLFSKPQRLLQCICQENAVVFPAPLLYTLDTGSSLARLRLDIEAMHETDTDFPHRTFATFKSFDKKYKPRKLPR
ncbi:MAG: hypothetical protein HY033_02205 [Ignavibacteriae bacterium]|nr:hypothetical protein [Ignavibacteriota bacterium]